jgi:L-rhamnose mutarotase
MLIAKMIEVEAHPSPWTDMAETLIRCNARQMEIYLVYQTRIRLTSLSGTLRSSLSTVCTDACQNHTS